MIALSLPCMSCSGSGRQMRHRRPATGFLSAAPAAGGFSRWPPAGEMASGCSANTPSSRYHGTCMVPSPLQHSSSRVLEFDHFRDVLGAYLSSPLGKIRVAQLEPSADRAWIARQQQLAEEARRFYSTGGRFDFSGLFDAGSLLAKAR